MAPATKQGYILKNRITHIRGLPVSSTHAFRYTTLSFLLHLDALESRKLDLASGWLFGYGGRWARILGLRSQPYLDTLSSASIRQKLEDELRRHCLLYPDETFQEAWMMAMPSILGFEGINPLTVYFCYRDSALWVVVFEIHNTFGESHIHLLEVDKNEDTIVAKGYDHQWTFRRQFHVSPFNDRSGFYTVSVKFPTHPPMSDTSDPKAEPSALLPAVCIRLYTDPETSSCPNSALPTPTSIRLSSTSGRSSVGNLKLAAYLRATAALPLTTGNVIRELAKQPFVLFLTMPRILYHAWILHFSKHLDVFPRPEPHSLHLQKQSGRTDGGVPGGGVGWQEETFLESFARKHVTEFLRRRVCKTGVSVVLIPSNPNVAVTKVPAVGSNPKTSTLEISYLSPRFFTILFTCPSAEHAMLLGSDTEGLFRASSTDLFNVTFSQTEVQETSSKPSFLHGTLQNFRRARIPERLTITSPTAHFLDVDLSVTGLVASTFVLWSLALLDYVEKTVFQLTGSRFVEGQEPWNAWKRAVEVHYTRTERTTGL